MDEKEYLKSMPYSEYVDHIQKLQKNMNEANIDLLLLSMPENIYYASGYRSWYLSSLFRPVFLLVPKAGDPAIVLRFLEKTTVINSSWLKHIYCSGTPSRHYGKLDCTDSVDGIKQFINTLDISVKNIGIEAGIGLHYAWSLESLHKIRTAFPDINFVDGALCIQKSRMIKTPWEVEKIRRACDATEKAIVYAFSRIRPGYTTEQDIASDISSKMCEFGVEKISYLTVNSGIDKYSTFNSYATSRVVQRDETVLVDISGHISGYASDLTRTMYLGKEIPEEHQKLASVAKQSILDGFDALKPGKSTKYINQVVENSILSSEYGSYLVHSSGHGVGLNVVEFPTLDRSCSEPLQAGMVFALENGVYPYDLEKGADTIYMSYRLEDLALVTEDQPVWLSGPGKSVYSLSDFI